MRTFVPIALVMLVGWSSLYAQDPKWLVGWSGKATLDVTGGQEGGERGGEEYEGEAEGTGWIGEGKIEVDIFWMGSNSITMAYVIRDDVNGVSKGGGLFTIKKSTVTPTRFISKNELYNVYMRKPSCNGSFVGTLSIPSGDDKCWTSGGSLDDMRGDKPLPVGYARVKVSIDVTVTPKGKLKGFIQLDQESQDEKDVRSIGTATISFDGLSKDNKVRMFTR